ncbi:hypothetical protein FRB93_012321 [Tulasnella sp. JGI-2019a]|nr:hypothetical protein FRB93_012321 [Tulasnella sp. JGI-2019a]
MKSALIQVAFCAIVISSMPMKEVNSPASSPSWSIQHGPKLSEMEGQVFVEQILNHPSSIENGASALPLVGNFLIGERIVHTTHGNSIYWANFAGQGVVAHVIGQRQRQARPLTGSGSSSPSSQHSLLNSPVPLRQKQYPDSIRLPPLSLDSLHLEETFPSESNGGRHLGAVLEREKNVLLHVERYCGIIEDWWGNAWIVYRARRGVHLWQTAAFLDIFQPPQADDEAWHIKPRNKNGVSKADRQACLKFLLEHYDAAATANGNLTRNHGYNNIDVQPFKSTLWDADGIQLVDFSSTYPVKLEAGRSFDPEAAFVKAYTQSWGVAHRSKLVSETCGIDWRELELQLQKIQLPLSIASDMEKVRYDEAHPARRISFSARLFATGTTGRGSEAFTQDASSSFNPPPEQTEQDPLLIL